MVSKKADKRLSAKEKDNQHMDSFLAALARIEKFKAKQAIKNKDNK